ncbi:MAG: hypothetical protein CMF60_01525 [Magnetococcales bacterium]|nr:hypothetical protein [Magnetococcales bacterium]|tara:strand:+ start:79323 stop:80087 length:765 start_codon:yes stop_codon:yes gene_type:complete
MKINIHTSRFIAAVIFSHPLNIPNQDFPAPKKFKSHPEDLIPFINKVAKASKDRKLYVITKEFGRKLLGQERIDFDAANLLQSIAQLQINLNKVQTIDQATFEEYVDIYQKSIIKPDNVRAKSVIETCILPFAHFVSGRTNGSHQLHMPQLQFLASSFSLYWNDQTHNDMYCLTNSHDNIDAFHSVVSELQSAFKIHDLCQDFISGHLDIEYFNQEIKTVSDLGVAVDENLKAMVKAQEDLAQKIKALKNYFKA